MSDTLTVRSLRHCRYGTRYLTPGERLEMDTSEACSAYLRGDVVIESPGHYITTALEPEPTRSEARKRKLRRQHRG